AAAEHHADARADLERAHGDAQAGLGLDVEGRLRARSGEAVELRRLRHVRDVEVAGLGAEEQAGPGGDGGAHGEAPSAFGGDAARGSEDAADDAEPDVEPREPDAEE